MASTYFFSDLHIFSLARVQILCFKECTPPPKRAGHCGPPGENFNANRGACPPKGNQKMSYLDIPTEIMAYAKAKNLHVHNTGGGFDYLAVETDNSLFLICNQDDDGCIQPSDTLDSPGQISWQHHDGWHGVFYVATIRECIDELARYSQADLVKRETEEILHAKARAFMERFQGREKLSLDEWLMEYGHTLSRADYNEAVRLLDQFQ